MNYNFKENTIMLVAGLTGFISFHVSKKLLEISVNIISTDNLNDYYERLYL